MVISVVYLFINSLWVIYLIYLLSPGTWGSWLNFDVWQITDRNDQDILLFGGETIQVHLGERSLVMAWSVERMFFPHSWKLVKKHCDELTSKRHY